MIIGHGGNIYEAARRLGCKPFEIIDMSSNVNPLGPPSGLTEYLKENIDYITALPEVDSKEISSKFANRYGLDPEYVLAGSGTTQFIYTIPQVLGTRKALILGPGYSDYADACIMHNVDFDYTIARESLLFQADIASLKNEMGRRLVASLQLIMQNANWKIDNKEDRSPNISGLWIRGKI